MGQPTLSIDSWEYEDYFRAMIKMQHLNKGAYTIASEGLYMRIYHLVHCSLCISIICIHMILQNKW